MYFDELHKDFKELNKKLDILIEAHYSGSTEEKEWLSGEEVMPMLNCKTRKLQQLRSSGKLPFSKPFGGNKIYYRRIDVEQYIKKDYCG